MSQPKLYDRIADGIVNTICTPVEWALNIAESTLPDRIKQYGSQVLGCLLGSEQASERHRRAADHILGLKER